MENPYWWFELRTWLQSIAPVEVALPLGLICFALSWIRPAPIVSFAPGSARARFLAPLGTGGALSIVAVATASSWYTMRLAPADPSGFGAWWSRPAPLVAALAVILIGAVLLRTSARRDRANLAPVIAPRRPWHTSAPQALLWVTICCTALLAATTAWHTAIGVSAPASAHRYGIVPDATSLPVYFESIGGYVAGAGWPNHLATILALIGTAAAVVFTLGADARRALPPGQQVGIARADRATTARLLVGIALGGTLLTLGAVWAHVGFIGEVIVGVFSRAAEPGQVQPDLFAETGYAAIAPLLHRGGYLVQGIGAGWLLRLAVDVWRATRGRTRFRRGGIDPDTAPAAAAASAFEHEGSR